MMGITCGPNSMVMLEEIMYEKERRHWRNQHSPALRKTASWKSAMQKAMEAQMACREIEFEINDIQLCRMPIGGGEIHYIDHNSELCSMRR